MQPISDEDVRRRLRRDNPWWQEGFTNVPEERLPRRVYFEPFCARALDRDVQRAVVLLGPRRVGKTVMLKQLISEAIVQGFAVRKILYVSVDTPVYAGYPLEKYLSFFDDIDVNENYLILFDEIQYLKDWEIHLKDLVDSYPNIKFVATGSAAAALRLKSQESGAGRFSDFMLPPLTFFEFLKFQNINEELVSEIAPRQYKAKDIARLNAEFVNYLNYGGYPEAVMSPQIRENSDQFIRNDIIDKVLLKDLPSLYGINDIQELNRLFSFLAYNAGSEASLERITKESGISKPTIKKYIEYLESAFLIIKIQNVNENCKSLQRERAFKVYLNNPSMRAALFSPVLPDDTASIGHLAESAIFSQWQHSPQARNLRYARWKNDGEVDIVYMESFNQKSTWVAEIKWSDRIKDHYGSQMKNVSFFIRKNKSIKNALITSRTIESSTMVDHIKVEIVPCALYCYILGKNITSTIADQFKDIVITDDDKVLEEVDFDEIVDLKEDDDEENT